MFQVKVVEKIKIHILSNLFSKSRAVHEITWKKYGRARQATDVSIIPCIHFACCVTKARIHTRTHTHTHTHNI